MNAVVFPPSAVLAPVTTLLAPMNARVMLVLQEMEKCATVRRERFLFEVPLFNPVTVYYFFGSITSFHRIKLYI